MLRRLLPAALLLVSAAFQFQGPVVLRAGDSLAAPAFRDFFPAEEGLRWSGAQSAVVFPNPGPALPVRVELLISGWRPPRTPSPRVVVSAGGRSVAIQPGPGAQTLSLETTSRGWLEPLTVEIQSDTFAPGATDPRRLGVRVEEVRLIPSRPGLRIPPVGPILQTALCALLIAFIFRRSGATPRLQETSSLVFVLAAALLFTATRPLAGLWAGTLVTLLGVIAIMAAVLPRVAVSAGGLVAESARALQAGLVRLGDIHVVTLTVAATLLVTLAYRSQSKIEIDLGSGREVAVARGFGAFEGKGDLKSRRTPRTSSLDLSDFGGYTSWRIEATAAIDGAPRDVVVVRAGGRDLSLGLREDPWTTGEMAVRAPLGWRSGLVLTFPGGSDLLRVDRIAIDRGSALPSPRVLLAVTLTGLLGLVAFGSMGLSKAAGRTAAATLITGSAYALASDPLAAIPFVVPFFWIIVAATALAALATGLVRFLDPLEPWRPVPVAIAASVCGWAGWLAATAFPYYRGGHFVFHSSIAEEIWKGRFLIYYLPYPGSMLSEQAQWGQIVMPHPALYQTLVSPLASLPRAWFYLGEKVFLASLFASIVIVASIVAHRVSGPRAAAFAALLFASLVPGFQLLGLGHLMTILGVWASSLALPWLMFKVDDLARFRTFLGTAWLFTFCFLSYTAALLFTGAVLVWLVLVSVRANPVRARSVFTMLVVACTFAFLLYYVHWTLPFLMQSVPKILSGAGVGGAAAEATPILARLSLEPGKLSYSYGSMLIPLVAALGLWWLPRSWDRLVLLTWMGILFFVSAADVFFNFLLKHHYYVMLPVAVGLGSVLARIEARYGKTPARVVLLLVVSLGLQTAIDVALGRIP